MSNVQKLSPAALGNGDLSILIDACGEARGVPPGYGIPQPGIRRAGFRRDSARGELIPFGNFLQETGIPGAVVRCEPSLDVYRGVASTRVFYEHGGILEAETFCALHRNIVGFKRKISGTENGKHFIFRYFFNPRGGKIEWNSDGSIRWSVEGICSYHGKIVFTSDAEFSFHRESDGESFVWETSEKEFSFLLRFDDDAPASYDSLLDESAIRWKEYRKEGFVTLPDARIQKIYDTAQYHLRLSSTAWSVPPGIYDSHWNGHYFAFDEYFVFQGLATSGHLKNALKIADFRASVFPQARRRVEGGTPRSATGVITYPWETNELCEENSPRGFWYDHVFQAGNTALLGYWAYRWSGDAKAFAERWYPLICGSAEWLRLFHVERGINGKAVIGHCTDLERLGPIRYNPFMTACSAVAAFRAAAWSASYLGRDPELVPVWKRLASELLKNLPSNEKRYLPYENCDDSVHSIGSLAGIYPYGVLSCTDPLQAGAVNDYLKSKKHCGSMYENGGGVCAWYRCWETLAHAQMKHGNEAFSELERLIAETGSFGELYEIYDNGFRPWFTTAEGEFVHAVNTMLLQFDTEDKPVFAPALPSIWKDFSFKLQAPGGKTVTAVFENGQKIC